MNSPQSELDKVRQFMEANDQRVRFRPVDNIPEWEKTLRVALICEEVKELGTALGVNFDFSNLIAKDSAIDPVAALDALTDLMYVTLGTYHTLGLANIAKEAFNEVHESNMSKMGPDGRPIKDLSGKVKKGPNYFPPNLKIIVDSARKEPTIFDRAL